MGERYVIDGFLAEGGFATVYRARHRQIGRKFAVKVLETLGDGARADDFRARFLQEAQLSARIEHPGVVDVYDFGLLADGRAFLVMDLLEGHDLEHELEERGRLPASRIVPLFVDCLDALAEGHRQGIVHKDLKPSNLFLLKPGSASERLVILDFGIARVFADQSPRVTQEGGFTGTPAYLAPEYIRTQSVTPALDVYQMGLILIEMLTGRPAVHSETSMGYLLAHCIEEIELPKALADTELGEICLRAVRKEPELRFGDAAQFRDALAAVEIVDLLDTQDFGPFDGAQEGVTEHARTLQMLELTERQRRELASTAVFNGRPGPSVTPEASSTELEAKPPTVLWVLIVALLASIGAASLVLVFALQEDDEAPVASPTSSEPAPDLVTEQPATTEVSTAEPPVPNPPSEELAPAPADDDAPEVEEPAEPTEIDEPPAPEPVVERKATPKPERPTKRTHAAKKKVDRPAEEVTSDAPPPAKKDESPLLLSP